MNAWVLLAGVGAVTAAGGALLLAGAGAATAQPVPAPAVRARATRATGAGGSAWGGRRLLLAVAAGVAVMVGTGWVAAGAAAAGAVLVVPQVLVVTSDAKRRIARLEALAAWTRRLADLMASRAVGSLDEALRRAAATAPAAIEVEARALVQRMGPQGLEAALLAFARDFGDRAGDHVAMALVRRARSGAGGLAKVLVGLSQDVDEQVRIRRDIEAARSAPLNAIKSLVVFTVATWVGMAVFARSYMAPFSTPAGQVALAVAVALFAVGGLWLLKLSRPVTGSRLLDDEDGPGR